MNPDLSTTQIPLESIDTQQTLDTALYNDFQFLDPYQVLGNTLPLLGPVNHAPLSLSETPVTDEAEAILNDPTSLNSHLPLDSVPTSSTSDPSPKDAISKSSPRTIPKKPGPVSPSSARIEKRKANTLAARRYRQARLDKVASLEAELKATQLERDALKVQVAKLQGESQALKDLVRSDK